jgi:hypothetical protein
VFFCFFVFFVFLFFQLVVDWWSEGDEGGMVFKGRSCVKAGCFFVFLFFQLVVDWWSEGDEGGMVEWWNEFF